MRLVRRRKREKMEEEVIVRRSDVMIRKDIERKKLM